MKHPRAIRFKDHSRQSEAIRGVPYIRSFRIPFPDFRPSRQRIHNIACLCARIHYATTVNSKAIITLHTRNILVCLYTYISTCGVDIPCTPTNNSTALLQHPRCRLHSKYQHKLLPASHREDKLSVYTQQQRPPTTQQNLVMIPLPSLSPSSS